MSIFDIFRARELPQIEGYIKFRDGKLSYDQWLTSDYVMDMWRRKAYYDEKQCVVDPNETLYSDRNMYGENPSLMSPERWNSMHTGPGWDDTIAMLPDATQESCVKFFGVNLTPVIINNRQVVYSLPVRSRTIRVDGEVDEETSAQYGRVTEACQHDLMADQLCKWTGLFTTTFQMTSYDEQYGRLVRHNLEPWRVLAFESEDHSRDLQNPGVMVCVMLTSEDLTKLHRKHDKPVWQVWWRDQYWFEQDPGIPFKNRECTEPGTNENPFRDKNGYPVKPIIAVKDIISDQIYERGSDLLIQQSQVLDRQLTASNYTIEYQGFAVPVVTGVEPEEMEANPHSPGAPVILRDPQAQYRFANPNSRPSEFLAATRMAGRFVARLYAVDPELVDPDSKVQSGVSRAISRLSLIERRKAEFPKWVGYERETYWISSIVWNTFQTDSRDKMREIDRFVSARVSAPKEAVVVEFAPLAPSVDAVSDALANRTNLDLNLTTREEILATTKDIDLEAAKIIAEQFKKTNEKDRGMQLLKPSEEGIQRIGQMGNRPANLDKERGRSDHGPGETMAGGHNSIGRGEE